ncbi:hypothetical protein [Peribacillus asahii]|uniref:hypothetical protein n=1 Tax=Peribacillus asahii TaxID=228899 RepID=UPI0038176646
MNEKDILEVFNVMMRGNLTQGLDLAAEKMKLDSKSLSELLKMYADNPNMTDEQLREVYQLLKK